MEWRNSRDDLIQWPDLINREGKEAVGLEIARRVHGGEVIGVGSGSTVHIALAMIAAKIREEGLVIRVIPASAETAMTCMQLGVPLTTLLECRPDWTFDGADEVDPEHNLIKGRGGAMFREKLLICSSPLTYILIDQSKWVAHLGERFPVPVEVFPLAMPWVEEQLRRAGATEIVLRQAKGKDGPLYTENGNWILDVRFAVIDPGLERQIKLIPGVIESGLFMGYYPEVIA